MLAGLSIEYLLDDKPILYPGSILPLSVMRGLHKFLQKCCPSMAVSDLYFQETSGFNAPKRVLHR